MQNRVLLIATAAFAGGVASTILGVSYLTAPATSRSAAKSEDVAKPTVAKGPAKASLAAAEGSCQESSWPYKSAGCDKGGAGATRRGDAIPAVLPVTVAIETIGSVGSVRSVEPVRKVESAPVLLAAAAVQPIKADRPSAPVGAPQSLEPVRPADFERSVDSASRQVRVISIDRAPSRPSATAQQNETVAEAKLPQAAPTPASAPPASAPAPVTASAASSAVAQPASATPAVSAVSAPAPSARVPAPAVPSPRAAVAAPAPITAAAAPTPTPVTKTVVPAAKEEASKPEKPARSTRRLAREEQPAPDAAPRARSNEASEERSGRPRRSRYGEWAHPEAPTRSYERRGYYAYDEAPPRAARRSGGRDSVFGWLGSSD